MQSVYVTVPNGNGWIHKTVAISLLRLQSDRRYKLRMDLPTHTPYVNNLHHCMNDFLDNGREDYWLSFDDDNPPQRNPLDLVEFDCDLVGFPTPVWHSAVKGDRPFYLNALDVQLDEKGDVEGWKPHENAQGLQEVDCIGSGCFLVSRRVLQKLRYDHPFSRTWNEDGTVKFGGDFSFCKKVKDAGFKIHAHFDYLCEHMNELPLIEAITAFSAMKE